MLDVLYNVSIVGKCTLCMPSFRSCSRDMIIFCYSNNLPMCIKLVLFAISVKLKPWYMNNVLSLMKALRYQNNVRSNWSTFRWFEANPSWRWAIYWEWTEILNIKKKSCVTHEVKEVYLFTFWSWRPHGTLGSLMALQRQTQKIMWNDTLNSNNNDRLA